MIKLISNYSGTTQLTTYILLTWSPTHQLQINHLLKRQWPIIWWRTTLGRQSASASGGSPILIFSKLHMWEPDPLARGSQRAPKCDLWPLKNSHWAFWPIRSNFFSISFVNSLPNRTVGHFSDHHMYKLEDYISKWEESLCNSSFGQWLNRTFLNDGCEMPYQFSKELEYTK